MQQKSNFGHFNSNIDHSRSSSKENPYKLQNITDTSQTALNSNVHGIQQVEINMGKFMKVINIY